jgi:hypothetical protein
MATDGEHCSSSCLTRDHGTYGECLRSKNVGDMRLGGHRDGGRTSTFEKKFNAETARYGQARKDGLNPEAVSHRAITAAYRAADAATKGA